MIIVTVHLASAVTGKVTELARMHISNAGGSETMGDYDVATLRGRDTAALDRRQVQRQGKVSGHARKALHVWHLVGKALKAIGYGRTLVPGVAPGFPLAPDASKNEIWGWHDEELDLINDEQRARAAGREANRA